ITDQGDVRSICAPCAPCLEFNALFEGRWKKFSQSADAWTSFCGCWPKRSFLSSSKMGSSASRVAEPHASLKPTALETDTREQAAPTRNQPSGRALRRLVNLQPALVGKFNALG